MYSGFSQSTDSDLDPGELFGKCGFLDSQPYDPADSEQHGGDDDDDDDVEYERDFVLLFGFDVVYVLLFGFAKSRFVVVVVLVGGSKLQFLDVLTAGRFHHALSFNRDDDDRYDVLNCL